MEICVGCGHRLGDGRFCTNCGRPNAAGAPADDTAERPADDTAERPAAPPPAYTAPPPPRFPLYAEDLPADPVIAQPPPPPPHAPPPPPQPPARSRGRGRSWLPLTLTALGLVLVAVVGVVLLSSGDGDEQAGDPALGNGAAGPENPPPSAEPSANDPPQADGPQDLARFATATASKTAEPNQDTAGNMVRYEAANMLDGVDETCWRMPGNGAGEEIAFTLAEPTELTKVGLINGYAKTSGRLDWYAGNRKVLTVEWVFDNGTVLRQSLSETREMQSMPISPVTTSRVLLRLVSVSEPGRGPSARNFTAISGVSLVGEAA